MPNRDTTIGSSHQYRFGFNSKEMDNDTYGGHGNEYDYGFRIYNPRIGRFLSIDPLTRKYCWYTPYQFASNTPIKFIDLDGAEKYDPSVTPTGITYIELATVPVHPVYADIDYSINAGPYQLHPVSDPSGKTNGYWVARRESVEYAGLHQDEWVVGNNGVWNFIKNAQEYSNKAGWIEVFQKNYGVNPGESFTVKSEFNGWKKVISNPMSWLTGATILAAGMKPSPAPVVSNTEGIVARGISGATFTESLLSETLEARSEDIITLYRGASGTEGSAATLYLTEDPEYAAAYAKQNGTTVSTYRVSRSGYNYLKNEGLINVGTNNGVLVNAEGKTIAAGGEISVSNQTIKNIILKSKTP